MKKNQSKITLVALLLVSVVAVNAQQNENALRLGAILGVRYNDFSNSFGTGIDAQTYSFTQGAGASYLYKKIIIGGEFYQSSARKTNATESLQYIGSNTTVVIGYVLAQGKSSRLESTVGFGISTNQIIAQNNANTTFQNISNDQFSIIPSLAYYKRMDNNLCMGLKVASNLGVDGDATWKYKSSEQNSGFKSNVNAFVVQLTVGGVIDFIKQKNK